MKIVVHSDPSGSQSRGCIMHRHCHLDAAEAYGKYVSLWGLRKWTVLRDLAICLMDVLCLAVS